MSIHASVRYSAIGSRGSGAEGIPQPSKHRPRADVALTDHDVERRLGLDRRTGNRLHLDELDDHDLQIRPVAPSVPRPPSTIKPLQTRTHNGHDHRQGPTRVRPPLDPPPSLVFPHSPFRVRRIPEPPLPHRRRLNHLTARSRFVRIIIWSSSTVAHRVGKAKGRTRVLRRDDVDRRHLVERGRGVIAVRRRRRRVLVVAAVRRWRIESELVRHVKVGRVVAAMVGRTAAVATDRSLEIPERVAECPD